MRWVNWARTSKQLTSNRIREDKREYRDDNEYMCGNAPTIPKTYGKSLLNGFRFVIFVQRLGNSLPILLVAHKICYNPAFRGYLLIKPLNKFLVVSVIITVLEHSRIRFGKYVLSKAIRDLNTLMVIVFRPFYGKIFKIILKEVFVRLTHHSWKRWMLWVLLNQMWIFLSSTLAIKSKRLFDFVRKQWEKIVRIKLG